MVATTGNIKQIQNDLIAALVCKPKFQIVSDSHINIMSRQKKGAISKNSNK